MAQDPAWPAPRVVLGDVLQLEANATATADLSFVRRRVAVRLVDASGKPAVGVVLTMPHSFTNGFLDPGFSLTTDALGRATIDPAPREPFTVRCGDADLGPIDPRASEEVQLRTGPR
jgi:hypothetical protein